MPIINFRITEEYRKELKMIALKNDMTMKDLVFKAIAEYIKKMK